MPKVVKEKKENISGTIKQEYKKWLLDTSKKENIPSSHLLEQGILLLKKARIEEENKIIERKIEEGIKIMLSTNDNDLILDDNGDYRLDEELM